MPTPQLSVAFVGLGKMGAGMARNIQSKGFPLTVYNRTAEKAQPLVDQGATAVRTPREAAASADVVVSNLMGDASVLNTLEGEDGLLAGMRAGAIHVGTSTVSPALSRRLGHMHAERGGHYVAAPVGGRPDMAAAGKLFSFVAGDAEAIERCRPVIEAYAGQMTVVGTDPGAASSMKLVANFVIAGLLELIGQAYVFAEKSGLDNAFVANIVKNMTPHPGLQEYSERIRTRRFDEPGFALEAGLKDLRLILDAAAEVRAVLPYANVVRDKCLSGVANGMGGLDWCSFTEMTRRQAGQPPQ